MYDFPVKGLYNISHADDSLAAGLQEFNDWFYSEYYSATTPLLGLLGPRSGKPVGTRGTSSPTKEEDGTSHLEHESRPGDPRVVGNLLWLVPIHPDMSCVSEQKSRTLQSPTSDDYAKLKHTIRCLKGTEG